MLKLDEVIENVTTVAGNRPSRQKTKGRRPALAKPIPQGQVVHVQTWSQNRLSELRRFHPPDDACAVSYELRTISLPIRSHPCGRPSSRPAVGLVPWLMGWACGAGDFPLPRNA